MTEYLFWGGPLHRKRMNIRDGETMVVVSRPENLRQSLIGQFSPDSALTLRQICYYRCLATTPLSESESEEFWVFLPVSAEDAHKYNFQAIEKHVPKHLRRRVDRRTGAVLH